MVFNQTEFNQFVIDHGFIGFFEKEITLKSGRKSNWYVNYRVDDAWIVDKLTDYILAFSKSLGLKPNCYYGVPEGATRLGVIASLKLAKSDPNFTKGSYVIPMGRGKPKEHGDPKDRFYVGAPKDNVVFVEDVTTTGGSLISELQKAKEAGMNVIAAIGLTNRMELRDDGRSVKEYIETEFKIPYHAMGEAHILLPLARVAKKPSDEVARKVEQEFEQFGVVKLKLL